jgi:charged multivesicular body protein 6
LAAALKQGNEALKEMQRAVSLEDVEKLMEDTAEAAEYQEQLRRMLGESWTGEDQSATEAELATLEAEVVTEQLPPVPERKIAGTIVGEQLEKEEEALPEVPTHVPKPVTTKLIPAT